jgi:hypothetical protein
VGDSFDCVSREGRLSGDIPVESHSVVDNATMTARYEDPVDCVQAAVALAVTTLTPTAPATASNGRNMTSPLVLARRVSPQRCAEHVGQDDRLSPQSRTSATTSHARAMGSQDEVERALTTATSCSTSSMIVSRHATCATLLGERFRKGALLGEGSFGKVFRCLKTFQGDFFAIKELTLLAVSNAEIMKEVSVLSMLDHPNIVRYHGMFQQADTFNIVMEYVSGEWHLGVYNPTLLHILRFLFSPLFCFACRPSQVAHFEMSSTSSGLSMKLSWPLT